MKTNSSPAEIVISLFKTAAFALYVFLFYELLAVPAILDWSIYGILLVAVLVFLLGWAIPAKVRLKWLVLAVTFLLALKSLSNLQDTSLGWQIGGSLIIFAVLLTVTILAAGLRARHYITVFLVAILLTVTIDLTEIPFWSEFAVKWKSPLLYPKQTAVDYFPLRIIDVDGDGVKEIVTQGNLAAAKEYIDEGGTRLEPLLPEENQLLVFKWTGDEFTELPSDKYQQAGVLASLRPDYINFPYYKSEWVTKKDEPVTQKITPAFSKTELVELSHDFGLLPFTALEYSLSNIGERKMNLDKVRATAKNATANKGTASDGTAQDGVTAKGTPSPLTMDYRENIDINGDSAKNLKIDGYNFSGSYAEKEFSGTVQASSILTGGKLNNREPAVLLLGKTLQAVGLHNFEGGSVLQELTPDQVKDISTAELFTADLNQDGIQEILLNTEYAKILRLQDNREWQVVWNSRDDSFRFEDFDFLGSAKEPEIIALSKSVVRNNRFRYITGYQLTDEGLATRWRVFTGLINLDAEDVNGDGRNELIGYAYKSHRIFVLDKHGIPVTQLLYAVTGALIAYGFYRRARQNKQREVA